jgi:hypothetical protein
MCLATNVSKRPACVKLEVEPPPQKRRVERSVRFGNAETQWIEHHRELDESVKKRLWVRPKEHEEMRQQVYLDAKVARKLDQKLLLRGEPVNLSGVYSHLHNYVYRAPAGQKVFDIVPPRLLIMLARSKTRGLEDRTSPIVAIERRILRAAIIRRVLAAQQSPEQGKIASIAHKLSRPACDFARAFGVVDATAAMMIYREKKQGAAEKAPALQDPATAPVPSPPTEASTKVAMCA